MAIFDERRLAANIRATVMGSIQLESRRQLFRCCLVLAVLTSLASAANARPGFSASEHYPGPWLEITQEIREVLALHKISACNQTAGRQSSRKAGEYLLYCTRDEKVWTSWHVEPAARKVRGPGKLFEDIPPPDSY